MRQVTTVQIMAEKVLERGCGQSCVDWAVSLMMEGYEGKCLTWLAGMTEPFSHFEIADLRDKTLIKIGAPVITDTQAVYDYAAEILSESMDDVERLGYAFGRLQGIYYEFGLYYGEFEDFAFMSFAFEELKSSSFSPEWPESTPETISEDMRELARMFIQTQRT